MSAALCFVGMQSLAEGGCGVQQYSSQLLGGGREPPFLLTAADVFPFPFFRDAITGPNVTSLLALFFLGAVMKASILGGIWGLNKGAAEEFQHKNRSCISLITLCGVK